MIDFLVFFPTVWVVVVSIMYYRADTARRRALAELAAERETCEGRRRNAVDLAYHLRAAARRGYELNPFVQEVLLRVLTEEEARKLTEGKPGERLRSWGPLPP